MISIGVSAQGTYDLIYNVLQTNCTFSSCHSNASQTGGLDLQGSGPQARLEVYNNLVGQAPSNNYAAGKGYELIDPGIPSRSFLFRKINNELDPSLALHPDELKPMPRDLPPLRDEEIELVRQWILHGAPMSGQVIDTNLIHQFYRENGVSSVPNPPAAPADNEGFQIHLGPFFVPPATEREVYLKFPVVAPDDQEINTIQTVMGPQSHHFILYRYFYADEDLSGIPFNPPAVSTIPEGLRDEGAHISGNIVIASQNPETISFPPGTAVFWRDTTYLDLNSHYINTSNSVLACDVYLNIYTQTKGTALQEMKAGFIPYLSGDFIIPNDGEEYTFSQKVPFAPFFGGDIFLWAISSHTHQWGTDYDIFKLNPDLSRGEHIYDASCDPDGEPGCVSPFYDYQHPPTRFFDEYYRIASNEGLEHEASYVNNGNRPFVSWGNFTSEDEMMLFIFFYLEDTTGLGGVPTSVSEATLSGIRIFPNPANGMLHLDIPDTGDRYYVEIVDMTGAIIWRTITSNPLSLYVPDLGAGRGLHLLRIMDERGNQSVHKLMLYGP